MSIKKEPPDKYRCFKLPIYHILFRNNDEDEEQNKKVEKQMETLQNAMLQKMLLSNINLKAIL